LKYFKKSDEPNAPGLSNDEVDVIQKKIMQDFIENSNPFYSSDEIKHKESLMEGRSMKLVLFNLINDKNGHLEKRK